ncbi:hypothetical protein ABC345_19640 [Shouchella sp. 1P09AA]|uniref:O-antigen ligase family protein n=1 Tax=unclassified Shouchella TaxID=2893065 RepID=UPI0039A36E65
MQSLIYPVARRRTIPVYVAMSFYAGCAPIAVIGTFQHLLPIPTSVLLTFLTCLLFILVLMAEREVLPLKEMNRIGLLMIGAVTFPALLSLLGVVSALSSIQSVEYLAYMEQSLLNRLINLTMYSLLSICLLTFLYKNAHQTTTSLMYGYTIGIIILTAGGIWQFLHFTIGYPMPGFETRAYVHSVNNDVLFNFRLTSFTDEPSFLVPFLIDGLIIGALFLTRKTYLVFASFAVLVLVLSFSVSGYINLAIVGFTTFLLLVLRKNVPKKIFLYGALSAIGIALAAFTVFPQLITALFMPILGRLDGLFDVMHHSRLYMLVFPFIWLFDYSPFNTLLGFGPGSYDFLARTKFLSHQGAVSGTSNNVFVDLLFEHGLIGGLLFAVAFLVIATYLWKARNAHLYYSVAFVLWIHLGITSLYRADFASPRFWLIIVIVAGLTELARQKISIASQKSTLLKAKVTTS